VRTLRLWVLAVGLVGLVGGGFLGLLGWATVGTMRAESARHRDVARRIVDAMEAELSDLVAREEARSFLEYRAYYLPERNAGLGNVVRSPLTDAPEDPMITGYFQRDPDGTVHSPSLPRDNELALALDEGWTPPETASRQLAQLTETVRGLQIDVRPSSLPSTLRDSEEPLASLSSRGRERRSDRMSRRVSTNKQSLEVYNQKLPVQQAYRPDTTIQADDVRISPLRGRRAGDDLVLYRTVELGGTTTVQGFVVGGDALHQVLYERVIAASDLEAYVDLGWGTDAVGAWTVHHRFAEPFDDVRVTVGLQPLPGLAGFERSLLWTLSIAGLLLTGLVALALGWAVRAELVYAARRADFVAAVSHELKTPLTSIRMYAEMLRDGMVPDPERQRVYHATITAESERLTRLIANVLELSRLEQGGPSPRIVSGDLAAIVEEAVAMLRPHAEANGVTLSTDVPSLPPVLLDHDALVQVVMNLVDNAIKFGGPGSVTLSAHETEDGVQLLVRDGGPGVPERQLRAIFEPFYRGERELTRTTKGTGIGLALVAGLMEDMGGTVRARNADQGGLEVALTLRAA
jgi:signal transduction histidine kinase